MTPAELLDDHVRRPRNVGKLLNASAVGDVGSIVVGDALRFYLSVDAAKKQVTAAKFQVFNCADQVGSTSALTELVVGMDLESAKRLGPVELARHLGGLESSALPPLLWGAVGLRAAVAAYQGEAIEHDHELDPLLCRCYAITDETVRQAISVGGCTTVDDVVTATGAGTGCGSCRADIPKLIDEVLNKPVAAPAANEAKGPQGRIQTLLRIQRLVETRLSPDLRQAGGDVELWDFDGRQVKVRVKGALIVDQSARRAALAALELLLKSEIDPGLSVDDGIKGA